MDSTEELQKLEITALQSIYAEDFIECPPPRVWKVRVCAFVYLLAMCSQREKKLTGRV